MYHVADECYVLHYARLELAMVSVEVAVSPEGSFVLSLMLSIIIVTDPHRCKRRVGASRTRPRG